MRIFSYLRLSHTYSPLCVHSQRARREDHKPKSSRIDVNNERKGKDWATRSRSGGVLGEGEVVERCDAGKRDSALRSLVMPQVKEYVITHATTCTHTCP